MSSFFGHLSTVNEHRRHVCYACFKMGIYWQGLTHDLSKYTPAEFWPGVKYFLGDKSPTVAERQTKGYSSAWMHHKGRNKHHFEYWVDYTGRNRAEVAPVKMPLKYVAEMVADRYAACRTYRKENYTKADALNHFMMSKDIVAMHPETKEFLIKVLTIMANDGEDAAFNYMKKLLKKNNEY